MPQKSLTRKVYLIDGVAVPPRQWRRQAEPRSAYDFETITREPKPKRKKRG